MASRSRRSGRPMRESDRLAQEASSMEAKLRALREQMSSERKKWQSDRSANGGSLWRSGRADRGSIRNYHNDVRKRGSKRRSGTSTRRKSPRPTRGDTRRAAASTKAAAPPSLAPAPNPVLRKTGGSTRSGAAATTAASTSLRRPRSARRLISRAEAPTWKVADVLRWLDVLSLSQYKETFAKNQISGEVLLELTSEDLDFMSISILGHRKILLKGVQTLQRAVAGETPLTARRDPPPPPATFKSEDVELVYDDSAHNNNVGTEVKAPKAARGGPVHWSEATPLSQNKVTNEDVPVNLADGVYDEAAQRAAFQQAVMEWRSGGKAAPAKSTVNTDGMWTNPFADAPAVSSAAAGAGGAAGAGAATAATTSVSADAGSGSEPREGGGRLLKGSLDVAAEHAAFERAVEAWRMGSDLPATKISCYQCYKLFYKESAKFEAEDKSFCSAKCLTAFQASLERARKQQEAAAKRREDAAAQEKARAEALEAGRTASRLGTPLQVQSMEGLEDALAEAQSTLAKVAPVQANLDDIWAMDVQF